MKIYLASSWRNLFHADTLQFLEKIAEVYNFKDSDGFRWSSIDPNWQNWSTNEYEKALNHPLAQKGFDRDFEAMHWADCCVLLLPAGRSANAEAGWMKGQGKKVYVFSPVKQEPELMYKMFDGIFDDIFTLRDYLINGPK